MNPKQYNDLITKPTLKYLGDKFDGLAIRRLLYATPDAETHFDYLKQIKGPALGPYQCEPVTHADIWRYLERKRGESEEGRDLCLKIRNLCLRNSSANLKQNLINSLPYAAAICRIHYWRIPEPLPHPDDTEGLYDYYKKYYNTAGGASTKEKHLKYFEKARKEID